MRSIDRRTALALGAASALFPGFARAARAAGPSHALSLYGDIKYPPGFAQFDHVVPDAPKGGFVRFGEIGTFDNLNPYILRGVSFVRAANTFMASGALFDSLMAGSADEPGTAYGLIADGVELAPDRLSVTFTLHPEARFHDGRPITAEDVAWTFRTLIEKGNPVYAVVLADVEGCEALDPRRARFTFKAATNRQLPLVVAGLPVLPRHWWDGKEFDRPTLEPPLGNGPYRIAEIQAGRMLVWERVKDYWAVGLPVNKGTNNFDRVQADYYRDTTVLREAFKGGLVDIREEHTAADWANAYDFPAFRQGLVKRAQVTHRVPQGMQSFVFNTRRPIFQDVRVRRALGYALDFVWYNKTYFYDSYKRTTSWFENSDMAARGAPAPDELAVLEPYRGRVADAVLGTVPEPPTYPDETAFRGGLREAFRLLGEAGWVFKDGRLTERASGRPFAFEFLLDEPRLERVVLPFLKNLERLGIQGTLRNVDAAQYDARTRDFDFDMISIRHSGSLNPGNELRSLFTSRAADTPDSSNVYGIKDPVVDEMVERIIAAETRPQLVTLVKALDRVLLHGHYGVPCWYSDWYRVAWWDKFGRPESSPPYASLAAAAVPAWWVDPARSGAIAQAQETVKAQ
jgi:microcin C transport system substrate-binding protein